MRLGLVSKSFYNVISPIIKIERYCKPKYLYPNLEISNAINHKCIGLIHQISGNEAMNESFNSSFDLRLKSVKLHDWEYADLANVLVLDGRGIQTFGNVDQIIYALKSNNTKLDKLEINGISFTENASLKSRLNIEDHFSIFKAANGLQVKDVSISHCSMSDDFVQVFSTFLKSAVGLKNVTFENMHVSYNSRTLLFSTLLEIPLLQSFSMTETVAESMSADELIQLISKNQLEEFIFCSTAQLIFSNSLSPLEANLFYGKNLKKLAFSTPFAQCELLAMSLKRLKNLEAFCFDYQIFNTNGLDKLYKSISSLKNLKRLSIITDRNVSVNASYLKGLKKLTALSVWSIRDDEHFIKILKTLSVECPIISKLFFSSSTEIAEGFMSPWTVSPTALKVLDKLVPKLRRLALHKINIPLTRMGTWAQSLTEFFILGFVDLQFSRKNWIKLSKSVCKSKTLKSLTMEILGAPSQLNPIVFNSCSSLEHIALQRIDYRRDYYTDTFVNLIPSSHLMDNWLFDHFHRRADNINFAWRRLAYALIFWDWALLSAFAFSFEEEQENQDKTI